MSIILDLLGYMQEDLIHWYITRLKFYIQRELHKDLAYKIVLSLDVAIALAKQYDLIMFDKNNNKNNKLKPNKSSTITIYISNK